MKIPLYSFSRHPSVISLKAHGWLHMVVLLLRWAGFLLLAGVFLYAGAGKILDPRKFADAIAAYQLLPDALVNPVALVLPILEIALVVLLFVSGTRRLALSGMGALLIVFLLGLVQALARGIVLDCGCFGSQAASHSGMVEAIVRDVFLLVVVALLFFDTREYKKSQQEPLANTGKASH